jgi:hypothetical protein
MWCTLHLESGLQRKSRDAVRLSWRTNGPQRAELLERSEEVEVALPDLCFVV